MARVFLRSAAFFGGHDASNCSHRIGLRTSSVRLSGTVMQSLLVSRGALVFLDFIRWIAGPFQLNSGL